MKLIPIKFLLLLFLFNACGKTQENIWEDGSTDAAFQLAVDKQLELDSTQIGINTIISDLDVPWEIAWGPDNWIWFTEQRGQVSKVNPDTGERKVLLNIPDVWHKRSTGLLGMALPHSMNKWPYVVVNYTHLDGETKSSKLVRYTYTGDTLINPLVLLEVIGNNGHNGSRVTIAPDGKVIWTTGDAVYSELAQDTNSLNGKILRVNIDGSIPEDNPIKGSAVWSWGYRNMQGLVYASNGHIYTSEHGAVTDDEVNYIRKGGNYGYPDVTGFCDTPDEKIYCSENDIVEPLIAWTPTIAPAGIDYYDSDAIPEWKNSLLLTTLRNNNLRVLKLNKAGDAIISEEVFFNKEFGRLRDICISPSGDIYVSTSNRDWNPSEGFPQETDDRIIRIFKMKAGENSLASNNEPNGQPVSELEEELSSSGSILYNQYCTSCHKVDGNGVEGIFPPLVGSDRVTGDKTELIRIALQGLKTPEYDQQMPGFNFLTDKQLTDLLTYVRSEFGNKNDAVTMEEIAKIRQDK